MSTALRLSLVVLLLGATLPWGFAAEDDHNHDHDHDHDHDKHGAFEACGEEGHGFCGEHGCQHGDHCECDEFFVEVEIKTEDRCVRDDDACTPGVCGEGGCEEEGGICHCHRGYMEHLENAVDRCEPIGECEPGFCGEHGCQHDDHCDCMKGYTEDEKLTENRCVSLDVAEQGSETPSSSASAVFASAASAVLFCFAALVA